MKAGFTLNYTIVNLEYWPSRTQILNVFEKAYNEVTLVIKTNQSLKTNFQSDSYEITALKSHCNMVIYVFKKSCIAFQNVIILSCCEKYFSIFSYIYVISYPHIFFFHFIKLFLK